MSDSLIDEDYLHVDRFYGGHERGRCYQLGDYPASYDVLTFTAEQMRRIIAAVSADLDGE
jgi:hypothetical protein